MNNLEKAAPAANPTFAACLPHRTVLLVDDADATRVLTRLFLANFGYSVETARTAEEALVLFQPRVHDVVVTDNSMPGISGSELAHIVKVRSPSTPVVMYTGMPPEDCSCIDALIRRPTHLLELRRVIEFLCTPSPSQPPPIAESPPTNEGHDVQSNATQETISPIVNGTLSTQSSM